MYQGVTDRSLRVAANVSSLRVPLSSLTAVAVYLSYFVVIRARLQSIAHLPPFVQYNVVHPDPRLDDNAERFNIVFPCLVQLLSHLHSAFIHQVGNKKPNFIHVCQNLLDLQPPNLVFSCLFSVSCPFHS